MLWPVVAFSQELSTLYSVNPPVEIRESRTGDIPLVDFKGVGQKGVWLAIFDRDALTSHLIYYDLGTQRVLNTIPLTGWEPTNWYPADIDGNGISEIVIFNSVLRGPTSEEYPSFRIFRMVNNSLLENRYTGHFGFWGKVGDITGDQKDELFLFHHPTPEDNDDGPIDVLVLSWNGSKFDIIARIHLPRTFVRFELVDLNNNGRDELIALKSDPGEPIELAIYSYTGNSELNLVDEMVLPMDRDGFLNHLWTQPLTEGGYRIIVPVPERYVEDKDGWPRIVEYRGYRLIANQLIREPELLHFEWEYYDQNLPWALPAQSTSVNINGSMGYLQIRDNNRLELIKEFPPALPKR